MPDGNVPKNVADTSLSWYFAQILRSRRVSALFLAVAAALLIFILLNPQYILAQLRYTFGDSSEKKTAIVSGIVLPHPVQKGEPNMLFLERLGIKVPIQYVTEKSENVFQKALIDGVVHYPGTANPGRIGNVYIFGHSSDYIWSKGKYKTIFALLPKVQKDDQIVITDAQGTQFTYRVFETKIVKPTDGSVLNQGDGRQKLLTLQTSYPLGTALKRFIVRASLIEETH